MNEKGLVFGKGFLGKRIAEELGYELSDFRILDKESLENYLTEKKPTVVINVIGKTGRPNIDWCESHKEETIFSNITIPSMLASFCSKQNIYLVHISSGCIYFGDNNGKGFSELDNPNFEGSLYSRTKILSEKILLEYPCLQLRIRMPIDDRPSSRNFIDKIREYEKLIDTQNSMTTVPHFLEGLRKLITKRANGIYNFVNPGTTSAVEVMNLYKEIIDSTHQFEKFSLEDLDKVIVAKRSNCYLNTDKLKSEGIILPEINNAVKECLENYKQSLKKMKGIILAGGTGSRLWPLTQVTNKHLLPVGQVPMIEFPLNTLNKIKVNSISIVTGGEHFQDIAKCLSSLNSDINFSYHYQHRAGGIAQALSIVEPFIKNEKIAVILGDNIFEEDFYKAAKHFENSNLGAMLFLKKVDDPERFGVAEIKEDKIISIEEKPKEPKSNLAVTGLYFYDSTVFEKIRKLKPSERGELEITDVNNLYLQEGRLGYHIIDGFWSDAGTQNSLPKCSDFVKKSGLSQEIYEKLKN